MSPHTSVRAARPLHAALLSCLAGILLLLAGIAQAQEPPAESPAEAEAEAEAVDPTIEQIESLRAAIAENRENLREIDMRANEAKGDDVVALRTKAIEVRLDSVEKLKQLVTAVAELEAAGGDASSYRPEVVALLSGLTPLLEQHLDAARQSIETLQAERQDAAPEDLVALEQRIARQSELVGRLLAVGVDAVEMIETMEIDAPAARKLVSNRLAERALVLSGRIELQNESLADAEARQAASPDDAGARAKILGLQAALAADTKALSAQLPLMDRLELKTAEYKQLLISSTGEITSDVFDAEVARGLLAGWTDSLRSSLVQNGPGFVFKTVLFLILVTGFWMLSRFVRKLTEKAVEAPNLRFSQLLKRMIVSVASGSVMLMGVLVGMSQLGVQVGPLLAGLGIAGFVLGFALQETLANFAAGVMILAYRPYDVSDLIDCAGGVFGKVSHMSLVSTTILTVDNQTKIVPNGKIWGDVITNLTAQRRRRVDMVFGISYSDDIPHAEQVLSSIVKEHPKVLEEPEPIVKLHELGDSSVNFVVRPWASPEDYWDVYWDITREVKLRFDREGVSIPFPQRDVHFYPAQGNGSAIPLESTSSMGTSTTAPSGQSEPDTDS